MRIEATDLSRVTIFNAIGQQVYDGSANGDDFECDLGGLVAGIYIIRIETTNGVAAKRLTVTK